jgi:Cu2+-exporting ATPase
MGHGHAGHDHNAMTADFRRRFWVSLIVTVPVLALSPLIQNLFGLKQILSFPGDSHVLFSLSAIVFFYGGWPFLTGLINEVSNRRPGMMTLIGVAITVAFVYSTAVVFSLPGKVFFWELVTLIDIMLLGHWIEMKSVLGASRALEALVQLLPATGHRLKANDEIEEVPVADLKPGDRVLVKPGERVPIDGIIVKGRSSFNEAMLTGESRPIEKTEGREAVGGAVNGEGAVTLEVRKIGNQTSQPSRRTRQTSSGDAIAHSGNQSCGAVVDLHRPISRRINALGVAGNWSKFRVFTRTKPSLMWACA